MSRVPRDNPKVRPTYAFTSHAAGGEEAAVDRHGDAGEERGLLVVEQPADAAEQVPRLAEAAHRRVAITFSPRALRPPSGVIRILRLRSFTKNPGATAFTRMPAGAR